jgi:hypothetical protein
MCVNTTKEKQSNILAHYNCFRFHLLFGGISLWILLSADLNREINQSSWWKLIIFPSMLIYMLFDTHLKHPLWLNFSWIRSSSFMACGIPLFTDRDPTFTSNFWKELFKLQGTNCISAHLIIPRLMVKLKFSTSVWKHI